LLIACIAALALTVTGTASANQLVTITIPSHGELDSKWLSYSGQPRADVLLPSGYNPHRRYPLLILLAGLQSNYATWAQMGVAAPLEGLNAIVVMPEGGSGWYTDWWNDGERGSPAWESYELNEVIPYVRAHYRILPQRRYHAIAGVSMGGLGAAYLAGRLPGYFGSMASLSGFVDLQYYPQLVDPGMGLTSEAPLQGDDDSDPVEGPPDGFYFAGHNPTQLAMNLKHTRLFETTGTGTPSSAGLADPFSGPTAAISLPEGSALESLVIYPMNQLYHQALTAAAVNSTYQVHAGGHDSPDFLAEVKAMVAWGLFKPVVTDPRSWMNDTVATTGHLWAIGYRFSKPPDQLVRFKRTGRTLSVSSAGSPVTITTSRGCVIHTPTPATIHVPRRKCRRL
jgi:S-formylglutathione hydrolase FrmB